MRLKVVPYYTIRLRFDGRSATYQRSLTSQWHNPLATCNYTDQGRSWSAQQACGRNVGRRMVVARSNCSRMAVERRSNRSRIVGGGYSYDSTAIRLRLHRATTIRRHFLWPYRHCGLNKPARLASTSCGRNEYSRCTRQTSDRRHRTSDKSIA